MPGSTQESFGVAPLDAHNAKMIELVHPPDWANPDPSGKVYDLVAIGAGAGGLVSAKRSARRGGASALIEAGLAGGDCLVCGCVPSKALLHSAKEAKATGRTPDFGAVMERMRRLRAEVAVADACTTSKGAGTDVFVGRGRFTSRTTVEVTTRAGTKATLNFKQAVIATGGRPTVPAWLQDCPHTTSESLFNLTERPASLLVVGAGAVALEMAQAFALLGSSVTVLVRSRLLSKDTPEVAEVLEPALAKCGIRFVKYAGTPSASATRGVTTVACRDAGGTELRLSADLLLCATGRRPNIENLGLEAAGVKADAAGVHIDDELRSVSNPRIYAVGDCSNAGAQFTHLAGMMADMVVENILFGAGRKLSELAVPKTTYTSPEVASVSFLRPPKVAKSFTCQLAKTDRGLLDGLEGGFVKLDADEKGTIVGATIVAPSAGEMISELTVAVQHRLTLADLAKVIHPYPTLADGIAGCCFQARLKQWPDYQPARFSWAVPALAAAAFWALRRT